MALKNTDQIKISVSRAEAKIIRDCLNYYGYKFGDDKKKAVKEKARFCLVLGNFFNAVSRRAKSEW